MPLGGEPFNHVQNAPPLFGFGKDSRQPIWKAVCLPSRPLLLIPGWLGRCPAFGRDLQSASPLGALYPSISFRMSVANLGRPIVFACCAAFSIRVSHRFAW